VSTVFILTEPVILLSPYIVGVFIVSIILRSCQNL